MADRAHIPSSPACGQWETLLTDALDGLLKPENEATFAEHMAHCKACTALYEEASKGREWLKFLSPEPEVPAGLLDRILAQTGPGQVAGYGHLSGGSNVLPMATGSLAGRGHLQGIPASIPAWQRPGFAGQIRRFAEPRLLMTAAMAFFSIALTLNLTGVRLSRLRLADLRPTSIRSYMERRLTMASVPIIRYYDHLRFVYEVESRMRELRQSTEGEGQDNNGQPKPRDAAPGESKQNPGHKDGGSRMDPPQQQSGRPVTAPSDNDEYLETSLQFDSPRYDGAFRAFRRLQNGTAGTEAQERSTVWTA